MAFVFQSDENGNPRPKIRCDSCGGVIEDYADGFATLETQKAKPGAILEPIFNCAHCEEEAKKAGVPRRSMPIDHFMLYVLNDIRLTPEALEKASRNLRMTTAL
jgi:hypothetical protein